MLGASGAEGGHVSACTNLLPCLIDRQGLDHNGPIANAAKPFITWGEAATDPFRADLQCKGYVCVCS